MLKTTSFIQKGAMLAMLSVAAGCATIEADNAIEADDGYLVDVDEQNVILEGHDVVAFFTVGHAVQGSSEHMSLYHSAEYHFSSAANKQKFDADPERYKPQFGGHCSMAMSMGKLEPADVRTWSIVDGRLVVNRNAKAKAMWSKNPLGNLQKADNNWPRAVREHGKQG